MASSYDFGAIEPRWQAAWAQHNVYRAANPGQPGAEKPPYYVLDFFPYPSGAGLHVGHPLGYIASDIISRYKRMRGFNVLHPMGWDAFGLPAEQYAIETGVHPAVTTKKNIETYTRQLKMIGLSYDWDREIATCTPDYYKWTQWIFLKLFNAWYDARHEWTDAAGRRVVGRARPIEELAIPAQIAAEGAAAIADYRDAHRLAFLAEVPVNWCPALGTVLANEEVTADGRSERGNHPVFRRPMKQWMLRITEYADRLLSDLDGLDWPEPIKLMQRNWIGRSEGAYVDFRLADHADDLVRVYTTRPDTLFGATYMVLAPEHRLVNVITTDAQRSAVEAYVAAARNKTDLDRTSDSKKKTGVFTGAHAINPVTGERIPIWVADYVLASYGTGSIMAVPGSDTRDLEFAETFGLPVIQVVQPPDGGDWRGFTDSGTAVNSPSVDLAARRPDVCVLNGLTTPDAKRKMIEWLESKGLGEGTVQYKLRDWLFSRQRYWGEPFPFVFGSDGRPVPVSESELPVTLPEVADFRPSASSDPHAEPQTPLSRAKEWVTLRRDGQEMRRELNTMPNWAGSCWYYLRFCDPKNSGAAIAGDVERYWAGAPSAASTAACSTAKMGFVNLYMGGAEHAVLHLLYARFWHKVLYDLNVVSTPEPFQKLFNQGMIQSYAYTNARGVYIAIEDVELRGDEAYHKSSGEKLSAAVTKMSKSLKNVVNPDSIIHEYGADTLRLYEMYMGPLEASKPWNTRDIIGVHRFLQRVWRLVVQESDEATERRSEAAEAAAGRPVMNPKIVAARNEELERSLHKTIKKVQHDIEHFALNTAIAQMIVWVNEAQKAETIGRDQVERFLAVLAPFAPHICEELNALLGNTSHIVGAAWPTYDESLTQDASVEIAVQIKGKVRGRVSVPSNATDEQMVELAKSVDAVAKEIAGKTIQRAIVVKGRLVNFIV